MTQIDWLVKTLHEYGIYTNEQLDEAVKNAKVNISVFVSKPKNISKNTNTQNNLESST